MIAAWMLYALLVGALLVVAAQAAERVCRLLGGPVRWVWAAALVAALALPVASAFLPTSAPAPLPAPAPATGTGGVVLTAALSAGLAALPAAPDLDRPLVIGWLAATALLLPGLLFSMGVLHGRRHEWRPACVDGHPVLLAADLGPAVIGWWRMQVVLPAWVLGLDEADRALILAHEAEHIRRRDPVLLLAGLLAVLIAPWNVALWYLNRRLRLAIELDCDARVVAGGADPARYGTVLLEAGARCRRAGVPALATFAERAVHLETRLTAMTPVRVRGRRARAAAAGALALALLAAACTVANPLGVAPEEPALSTAGPAGEVVTVPAEPADWRAVVHEVVEARFPGATARGSTPQPLTVMVVIGPDGHVLATGSTTSDRTLPAVGQALDPAAISSIDVLKGGVIGLRNVSVIAATLRDPNDRGSASAIRMARPTAPGATALLAPPRVTIRRVPPS